MTAEYNNYGMLNSKQSDMANKVTKTVCLIISDTTLNGNRLRALDNAVNVNCLHPWLNICHIQNESAGLRPSCVFRDTYKGPVSPLYHKTSPNISSKHFISRTSVSDHMRTVQYVEATQRVLSEH